MRATIADLFPALRIRDYRLFWIGSLVSQSGNWMQAVAWGWLVLSLTNSAWWLGLTGFCGSAPALFLSPFAGALADRAPKRRLLLSTQAFLMVFAFLLAGLVISGYLRLWHIIIIALCNGITFGIDAPLRQAFVPALAGRENLMNAIALNSTAFNTARILGPAVAGLLLAPIGPGGCFLLNGVSYFGVLMALAQIRAEGQSLEAGTGSHFWGSLAQGFRYLSYMKDLLFLVVLIGVVNIFGTLYHTLLPIFARDIFEAGPRGLGILTSSVGFGALTGALLASQFYRFPRKGRIIVGACLGFSAGLLAFALLGRFFYACLSLSLVGLFLVLYNTTSNALVQTIAEESLRGRVVGIYMLAAVGVAPFGALLAGGLASAWGAQTAVGLAAVICAGSMALALLIHPALLRLRG